MSIAKCGILHSHNNLLFTSVLLICGIVLFASILVAARFSDLQLNHEVLHVIVKILGCMMAPGITGFLLMRQGEKENGYILWLACSVLVI